MEFTGQITFVLFLLLMISKVVSLSLQLQKILALKIRFGLSFLKRNSKYVSVFP